MSSLSLEIGGLVGVAISAGFVYFEVGKFATPQVPRSRFDETREVVAYVIGLFVGIPLALVWVFFLTALAGDALLAAAIDVLLLVVGGDLAQYVLLRTRFFGRTSSDPFYALGLRAGIGGLLALAGLSLYFGGSTNYYGGALAAGQAVAVVLIETTVGLRLLGPVATAGEGLRQRVATTVFALLLFGLAGSGARYGTTIGFVGVAVALVGSVFLYLEVRDRVLGQAGLGAKPASASESRFRRLTGPAGGPSRRQR